MLRVLLVEDEPMWQQGIAALMESESEMSLIGTVDNADDADVFFDVEKPDAVLVDWKIIGDRDGLEFANGLTGKLAPDKIILVTGSPREQIPENPYAYIPKSRIGTELVPYLKGLSLANR